ncbi:hypothetical protein FisN_21Hh141 [Fistulifera solaris]|uniref:Mechanosensitive ion channel MscS domain-containing protein n=1 Tax=Fistulifera solaris TaxID=1519565 RepID=A0A1Z5JRN9_FISSO|nr:hypothetical protein FisN_21Hh141 [Fistulifera solaris]|eukprot:GAX16700.1 hypothetical protein FisN_21Hh141 [Fistulifera solaris]
MTYTMKKALFVSILNLILALASANGENGHSMLHDMGDSIRGMVSGNILAGKIKPLIRKVLHLDRTVIHGALRESVHIEDILFLVCAGWIFVPALNLPYSQLPLSARESLADYYHLIRLFLVHVQQVAKLALLVYFVDIVKIVLTGMGFESFNNAEFPIAFAQVVYLLWGANRISTIKKYYIRSFISEHPDSFGRMKIINRLADAAIGGITLTVIMGILQVKMGIAMSSLFALGSAGTLAIGLASQGIAKSVINGLLLVSSDRIYEGDYVRFGNGKEGTIVKLGWMETVLRGSDEITVNIPNTDLISTPISNLSRIRYSQVKQVLRFSLKDRAILRDVMESIKEEVQLACPEIVTDGSRPFLATLTNYGPGFVEATVDFHFRIRPVGELYWENRQRVLWAIDAALKRHDVELK